MYALWFRLGENVPRTRVPETSRIRARGLSGIFESLRSGCNLLGVALKMYELVVLAVQLCRQCACFRLFEGTVTDKAEVDLRVQVVSCRREESGV